MGHFLSVYFFSIYALIFCAGSLAPTGKEGSVLALGRCAGPCSTNPLRVLQSLEHDVIAIFEPELLGDEGAVATRTEPHVADRAEPVRPWIAWWQGKSMTRVCKDVVRNILYICVYTTGLFAFSFLGGYLLQLLDGEAAVAAVQQEVADFEAQGFNATQIVYLAGLGIPPNQSNYGSLLEMQFYSATLITTVGYGSLTSYSAAGRWFAVCFSIGGLVLVAYLTLVLRDLVFRFCISLVMLLMAIFLPVKFGPGRSALLCEKVDPIFDQLDKDRSGVLNLWSIRTLLLQVHAELDNNAGVPLDPPNWETVCSIVLKACRASTGNLSRTQLSKAMKYYALVLAEEREKRQSSVLLYKIGVLFMWVLSGAAFYANYCPCMGADLGVAIYFIVVTLSTIGTGDVCPCTVRCEVFWFFHTILGLGIMASVVEVCAIHLSRLVTLALRQRMELSPHYSHEFRWGSLHQLVSHFTIVKHFMKSLCLIVLYTYFGAVVFSGYELNSQREAIVAFNRDMAEYSFSAGQQEYLRPFFKVNSDWSIVGAARFSFEALCTIGYGALAPRSSGGRTFLVFYVIAGLGLVGFQLERLAEVVRFVAQVGWDCVAHFFPWRVPSVHHDQRLAQLLVSTMDACEDMAMQQQWVTAEALQQEVAALCRDEAESAELLDCLLQGREGEEIPTRVLSVNLARLYQRLRVRQGLRDFIGGLTVMITLFAVSIPVFTTFEPWTVGDASWFIFITMTGIGLGDFVLTSSPAVAYWFFFVLITIGSVYIFVRSCFVISADLHRRVRIWYVQRWGRSTDASMVMTPRHAGEAQAAAMSPLATALPEEYTFTVTSLLGFVREKSDGWPFQRRPSESRRGR